MNNVLEWSTSIESGICMANLCEDWVDESFWRKAYNLSSGKGYRMTAWELLNLSFEPMGIDIKEAYNPTDIARFNFHGQYYLDADKLDEYLHFRCIPSEVYWASVKGEMERMMGNPMIAAMMPNAETMKAGNAQIAAKRMGPVWMEESKADDWVMAFYGSWDKKHNAPDFDFYHPSEDNPKALDIGYDEDKGIENLNQAELEKAAQWRGGEYLDDADKDIYTPVKWKCGFGHEFKMSKNAVLHGGHWCPECLKKSWNYPAVAKKSPFFAQVWNAQHDESETYEIPMHLVLMRVPPINCPSVIQAIIFKEAIIWEKH